VIVNKSIKPFHKTIIKPVLNKNKVNNYDIYVGVVMLENVYSPESQENMHGTVHIAKVL
jgi:hypothetical protein